MQLQNNYHIKNAGAEKCDVRKITGCSAVTGCGGP
jgi:hypothetical protein